MGPVMLVVFLVALLVNYAQVGPLFTLKPLQPKFEKINPAKGVKKYFSIKILAELLKNVLKLAAICYVAYATVAAEMATVTSLSSLTVQQIVIYILSICFKIFLRCALLIMVLAFMDFAFQKWQHEKQLRMSKQEVKDEFKQREGDPMIKARIRTIQRKMASQRMMEAVPQADVVVTNPSHLAVALRYVTGEMAAPQVVAKGAGLLAEKIKKLAQAYNIPLIEDKPLAQALYRLEVGQSIPEDFYQAVARILAYVYQLKDKKAPAAAR